MSRLKEIEWIQINEIVLELYYTKNLTDFERRALNLIKPLVPFDQANFRVVDLESGRPLKEKTTFLNTSEKMQEVFFAHIEPDKNYLKSLFESERSVVYIDSDMLSEEVRKQTSFYKNYLFAQNLPYGAGIIFIKDSRLLGSISLFRSDTWGDFTEKEAYMLDVLKPHLTKILAALYYPKQEVNPELCADMLTSCHEPLTSREKEILPLIIGGLSNEEISKQLSISNSTTKKHVYNIYKKYGVNNRLSLIRKIHIQ